MPQLNTIKISIHMLHIGFFIYLCSLAINHQFGADPVQGILHFTGLAALNTLLLTLTLSPLAKQLKQPIFMKIRRLMGIYCFAWACLHLSSFIALDIQFDWSLILHEITTRKYLIFGMTAWILLLFLTITSPSRIRKMCGTHWQTLHNSVYLIAILACVHFYISVKSDIIEPIIYLLITLTLISLRYKKLKKLFIFSKNN